MSEKIFYVDVETTGTDPKKCGIIQIGGIIEVDNEEKEQINIKIAPFPQDEISDEALAINKHTRKEISEFTSPAEAHTILKATLEKYIDKYNRADKFHLVAYNAKFDDDFLRAWFRKCGDVYYGSMIHWPPIDIATIVAFIHMASRNQFKDFKLGTVAKALGIELSKEDAHDAMADILATREIYKNLGGDLHGLA